MATIAQSELAGVSFPDRRVTRFVQDDSRLICTLDGIYTDRRGLVEASARLEISRWTSAIVERFDANGRNPMSVSLDDVGELREILECKLAGEGGAFLAGFETHTGRWQQHSFSSARVVINIDE